MKASLLSFQKLALMGIVLLYLAVTLPFLERWPPLQYDESWIGAVGYNLHLHGRFSTHVFGDLLDLNRLSLDRMPLHSYLQAASFKLFGFGIWQLRLPSVLMGAGVIVLTYQLLKNWLGVKPALAGAAILALGRLCVIEPYLGFGITDVAMSARHDITAAFFSAWGVKAFIEAEKQGPLLRFFEAGAATGLALLTHLYTLVLLAAFITFWLFHAKAVANRPRFQAGAFVPPQREKSVLRFNLERIWPKRLLLLATIIAVVSPWLIYVASNWALAKPQLLFFQGAEKLGAELGRFSFFDAGFYVHNLWREPLRYHSLLRHATREILPGIFVAFVIAGWWRACTHDKTSQEVEMKFLAISLPLMMLLLAACETFKYQSYLAFIVPLWLMAAVFAGKGLAERNPATPRRKLLTKFLFIFVIGLFLFQSVRSAMKYVQGAGTHASFVEVSRYFHQIIPPNATVAGSQRYWPVFRFQTFYDYQVPTARIHHTSYNATVMDLHDWFEQFKPEFLVYDDHWRKWAFEYKSSDYADARTRAQFKKILEDDYRLLQKTYFPGYGEIAIYHAKNEWPK